MRTSACTTVAVLACVVVTMGCVERRMLIRSVPTGAPVWIDEQPAGATPLDLPFAHYGARRIRVGPLRDENDKRTHAEMERVVEVEPPWYEKWPIDFFAEVLYPGRLVDEHSVPPFVLPTVEIAPADEGRVERLRADADAFRERALGTIPERAPGD